MFICGGAFEGIDSVIRKRVAQSSLGFEARIKDSDRDSSDKLLDQLSPEDLVKYGIIPELVGRIPVVSHLNDLDVDSLIKILTEPKNAILKQYKKLFEMDGIELEFSKDAIRYVAQETLDRKTGARGLRAVIEDILSDIMFSAPSDKKIKKIVISKKYIETKDKTDLEISY